MLSILMWFKKHKHYPSGTKLHNWMIWSCEFCYCNASTNPFMEKPSLKRKSIKWWKTQVGKWLNQSAIIVTISSHSNRENPRHVNQEHQIFIQARFLFPVILWSWLQGNLSSFQRHTTLVPFLSFKEGPVGDIHIVSIRANRIKRWIFSIFSWHWPPLQAWLPVCFFDDLQYLFCNCMAPLSSKMNSILPIKHHSTKSIF